ncbi:MAG: copper resistance protein CopC, partial [Paenisporosarcina sp.]|nr:copper resistance protein CopC [Paenisporosarcina sp.]
MKKWCLLFLLCLSLFTYTLPASAHANLLSSSPTQGAVLKTTPTDIRLLFTTSIDPTVYEFDVLD